jgi:AcrR family transcriptional regulator
VEAAARLATVEGLEGLSISGVAAATGMSKSGVFGLFGSKLELQLAAVDEARRVFVDEVVRPASRHPEGRERLEALCEGFLEYVERRVFPGGCFFASVAAEVGARAGPLKDRIRGEQKRWVGLLVENATRAREAGDLPTDVQPGQIALELSALLTGADVAFLLHEDPAIIDGVRRAIHARLGS